MEKIFLKRFLQQDLLKIFPGLLELMEVVGSQKLVCLKCPKHFMLVKVNRGNTLAIPVAWFLPLRGIQPPSQHDVAVNCHPLTWSHRQSLQHKVLHYVWGSHRYICKQSRLHFEWCGVHCAYEWRCHQFTCSAAHFLLAHGSLLLTHTVVL